MPNVAINVEMNVFLRCPLISEPLLLSGYLGTEIEKFAP